MSDWPYYLGRWQRLRRLKLQASPLCEACLKLGIIVAATAVDHRQPISAGGPAFPPLDGLASLCDRCHNTKSRSEQSGERHWFQKGCGPDGYPLDPRHPANARKLAPELAPDGSEQDNIGRYAVQARLAKVPEK